MNKPEGSISGVGSRLHGILARLPKIGPETAVHIAFAVAGVVLLVSGWTLYAAASKARVAAEWVEHTHEVLREIGQARENFAALESAQRAFLLSREFHFLAERDAASSALKSAISRLAILTADNPVQQSRTREAAVVAAERIRVATESEKLAGKMGDGFRGAGTVPLEARRAYDNFHRITTQMGSEERSLLAGRQAVEEQRRTDALALLAGTLLLALLLLAPAYGAVLNQSGHRRRLERQMGDLVESLPVAPWQIHSLPGRNRKFVFVAQSALRERGLDAAAVKQDIAVVLESIHDDDRETVEAAMDRAEAGAHRFDESYRVRMPDGSTRWIRSEAQVRPVEDGFLWSGYWADITVGKQLEAALHAATAEANRANSAKSSFLATMSHEIRTPMNGVMGLLELLSMSRLEPDQRTTLAVIRDSGRSLLRIIDDILDFSKVEAGRLVLNPVPASVAAIVDSSCEIHKGIASSKGLLLSQSIDPRISATLVFDPMRLGQILNNFISNALKFTPSGSVRVSAELMDRRDGYEQVQFSVSDTGIGVAPEAVESLFRPFTQAHSEIAGRYGGTGLGLDICRRLADLMGGKVEMRSRLGEGTTMLLVLSLPISDAPLDTRTNEVARNPRALTDTIGARRAPPAIAAAEAEGTLVLVVDDHPTNRLVLVRQVNTLGYAADVARDGAEALHMWRTRRIGLILTDRHMPVMDGLELARAIRQEESREQRARVPIIACTANAMKEEAVLCLEAGMDACLVKPVSLEEMAAAIDPWLTRHVQQPHRQSQSLLDQEMILEIARGSSISPEALVAEWWQAQMQDAALLRQADAGAQWDEVIRSAHRMGGASLMLGADALAQALKQVEKAARTQSASEVACAMAPLEAELAEMEAYLASHPQGTRH